MINLKCPNCGADITTDDAQKTGKCPYCNSRFAAEKKEEPKKEEFVQPEPDIIQHTSSDFTKTKDGKRPRIRFGLLILFLFINPFLFMGYIILTAIRQKAWDHEHNM